MPFWMRKSYVEVRIENKKRGYFRLEINEAIMHNTHGYGSSFYVDNHSLLLTLLSATRTLQLMQMYYI